MERKGIIAAGNMLVDHVHQIGQWPERGWLVEIVHSERATGGAPLNVLLTLAKMHAGLPLQAVGLIGEDNDGDYITAMLDQYHINRQLVQRTSSAPTSMTQVMTDAEGQRTFFHSPGANRLLDLPAFEPLDAPLKIFHLGYLLLLESLDRPDEVYGTRSARLLAQMRERKNRSQPAKPAGAGHARDRAYGAPMQVSAEAKGFVGADPVREVQQGHADFADKVRSYDAGATRAQRHRHIRDGAKRQSCDARPERLWWHLDLHEKR